MQLDFSETVGKTIPRNCKKRCGQTEPCYDLALKHLAPDQNAATAPPTLSGHREACPAFSVTREELVLLARHWCRIALEAEHFTRSRLASEQTDECDFRRIAELKDVLGTEAVEEIRSEVAAELMYELDE